MVHEAAGGAAGEAAGDIDPPLLLDCRQCLAEDMASLSAAQIYISSEIRIE